VEGSGAAMTLMFVYGLADPRTAGIAGIRYVGVSGDPTRRLHRHLRAARRREQTAVARWLRRLRRRPAMTVLVVTNREDAASAERATIAYLRANGADLVNVSDGGDGLISAEHIARLSEGMRRLWRQPEYRARMVPVLRRRNRKRRQS
jgi:predicted GIY-YIG superfamily endonuclease